MNATPWYRKRLIEFEAYRRTKPVGLTRLLYEVTPAWFAIAFCAAFVIALVLHTYEVIP